MVLVVELMDQIRPHLLAERVPVHFHLLVVVEVLVLQLAIHRERRLHAQARKALGQKRLVALDAQQVEDVDLGPVVLVERSDMSLEGRVADFNAARDCDAVGANVHASLLEKHGHRASQLQEGALLLRVLGENHLLGFNKVGAVAVVVDAAAIEARADTLAGHAREEAYFEALAQRENLCHKQL